MGKIKEIVLKYKFTLLIAVAIIVLSVIPIPEVKPIEEVPFYDKWVHMVMYAALTVAMWIDRNNLRIGFTKTCYCMMFIISSALGGILELVQAYLTTCRSGDVVDFEADALGAFIALIILIFIHKIWHAKNSAQQ